MIAIVLDHLWQSTLFAAVAGLLTLTLRNNGAKVRFWLWFAASVKFLIPFTALTAVGRYLLVPLAAPVSEPALSFMQPVAQPFSDSTPILSAPLVQGMSAPIAHGLDWTLLLLALWALGFAVIVARWQVRWSRLRSALGTAVDLPSGLAPVAMKLTPSSLEPGLVGIWRPAILLPKGITERLSSPEMDAIIAHELCHLRRRDNLLAATHMLVEALFWFHPLVWWIGARLNEERERACDESVLASGNAPLVYAEGILKVCKLYLNSPLACASGISGADLRKRVEMIMKNQTVIRLNRIKTALLALGGAAAVILPVLAGVMGSPRAFAQATERLDGWGQFKFGMTPDQARALPPPGQPWKYTPPNPSNQLPTAFRQFSTLISGGPVKRFRFDFDSFASTFSAKRGLLIIGLHSERKISREDCRESYLTLLPVVEAQYGSFAPLGFGLPPGSVISVHDIPGAKSQYRLADTSNGFRMEAIRTFGARYISVRMGYAGSQGNEVCFTDVWFQQQQPDQPAAPLPQTVDTSLSSPALSSHIASAQIRNVSVTTKVVSAQPVNPAPAQRESAAGPGRPVQSTASASNTATPSAYLANLPVGTRIISSGVLARVGRHNRYAPSLGGDLPVLITIISAPAHGTVSTQGGTAVLSFSNNEVTRVSSVTNVFYQSVPGYVGQDSLTYKRTSSDPSDPLNANTYTVAIYVK